MGTKKNIYFVDLWKGDPRLLWVVEEEEVSRLLTQLCGPSTHPAGQGNTLSFSQVRGHMGLVGSVGSGKNRCTNEVHMLWAKIKGWEGVKVRRETHLLPACV